MTRTTGATPEQVEEAAKRWWDVHHEDDPEGWANWDDDRDFLIADTRSEMYCLVPTDHRIVRVDDLRALIEHTVWRDDDHEGHAALSRIIDLIGGAE